MSNWTKEEIMAYADGQLEENSIQRIKEAISNDMKARDFYQSMVFSDEVIKDTMQQLESNFRINLKTSTQNNYEKENQKENIQNKIKGATKAISIKSIFIPALIGLSLFASIGYFVGQNTQQQMLMRGETEEFEQYRGEIEFFLNVGSDGENYFINENQENQMKFTILSTSFGDQICRKIEFENVNYTQTLNACKIGETWSYQLLE